MTQTTVRYFVTDIDEAIDFYCNRLGFRVDLPRAPGFAGLANDDLRLLLHEPGAGGAGEAGGVPEPGGWNRFQLVVGDLEAAVERLAADGASFRGEIVEGPGGRQILIEDPRATPSNSSSPRKRKAATTAPGRSYHCGGE
jgi:catechol 2,3-dioxygenase-like lactoylglutathione lyase family enzyme